MREWQAAHVWHMIAWGSTAWKQSEATTLHQAVMLPDAGQLRNLIKAPPSAEVPQWSQERGKKWETLCDLNKFSFTSCSLSQQLFFFFFKLWYSDFSSVICDGKNRSTQKKRPPGLWALLCWTSWQEVVTSSEPVCLSGHTSPTHLDFSAGLEEILTVPRAAFVFTTRL